MSICVKLKFWGVFKDYLTIDTLNLQESCSLEDLIANLQTYDEHNILQTKSIFALAVNGMIQNDMSYKLKNNDLIDILPPVTGG